MISGYLFYRGFRWEMLWGKWNRRIRSLLVPFILWNFLYYIGYVIGSRLPWVADVVGKGMIPFTLGAAIDAVINYTYNYVFWYLYQLIALTLLAPVLYPLLKRWQTRIGLMAVLWWMAWKDIQLPAVNVDALIYYGTAASLAMAGLLSGQLLCSFLAGRISGGCLGRSFRALFCAVCWRQPVCG